MNQKRIMQAIAASTPEENGPCSLHGVINCLQCYDVDLEDLPLIDGDDNLVNAGRNSFTLSRMRRPLSPVPVAIQRLMDEVRNDPKLGTPQAYDRAHMRHNRS